MESEVRERDVWRLVGNATTTRPRPLLLDLLRMPVFMVERLKEGEKTFF
jgi:hypothetical protein